MKLREIKAPNLRLSCNLTSNLKYGCNLTLGYLDLKGINWAGINMFLNMD